MEPKYCVTARNRLTGDRDVLTPPLSKEKAEEVKLKYGISRSSKRPYTHPKVEPYQPRNN
jgi:hypothetical protein